MLTTDQEKFLADFADKNLAELADAVTRNTQIILDGKIQTARDAKKAELKTQADALVAAGLTDFELNVVPKIK